MRKKKKNIDRCWQCKLPWIPDEEAVIFGTLQWDGHTYKPHPNCPDVSQDLRLNVG